MSEIMSGRKILDKTYAPAEVEDKLYKFWMDNGYFHMEPDKTKKPYCIVMPPPNITGQLHMGHALDNTVQDILTRFKRMQGYCTLWLPGTDHASIATEARIVDSLAQEGLTKEILGREKYLEKAWEWKDKYGRKIVEQLKKLGSSCDWDRERFTLDEGLSDAVLEVFLRLYDKGLIYRGNRITNWCTKCNTSISDIEVEYEEQNGFFWHIKYPVKGTANEFVEIATTRPETMLGDTAVAVNPDDERYKHLIGKTLILPLTDREIPVIADDYVSIDFGTGCVKITPAHDPNDYEVGLRHGLEQIRVINDIGKINQNGGKYEGLDRYEARKQIVKDLEELSLLVKTVPHNHNVGTCHRCHTVVEPLISRQWYVKMKPLADPAIKAIKDGETKFIPERFSKIYYNWMENIQDWCISRQLWWGHRIPAYYCDKCGHMVVARQTPSSCEKCGGSGFVQDPDTLDTWFSSALWPFSTLGWPEKTADLEYFYPTDVLVTAYDIIFFWVARMIFSGLEQMNQVPFKYVFIHGLVRDSQGRKMSKSLNNGIDPLDVIGQYGTDALRFALIIGVSPGNDLRYLPEKVESARNFANKIWNAARFVQMNFDENPDLSKADINKFTIADKWILSKLNKLITEVTDNVEKFEPGMALSKVYEFIWDIFCDWYIETVKPRLFDRESEGRVEAQYILNKVLVDSMKLLHPFMPFVTEEIYQNLIKESESIMISNWPCSDSENTFEREESRMEFIISAIRSIRNVRSEMNVPPSVKATVYFVADSDKAEIIKEGISLFQRLASASDVLISEEKPGESDKMVSAAIEGAEIYIPMGELIDISKEIERLEKELSVLNDELERVNGKLSNERFISKAPDSVVNEEKEKKAKYQELYDKTSLRLESLK